MVKTIVGFLIKDGKIRRGFLGIGCQNINIPQSIVHHYHLPSSKGLLIVSLEKNSPAKIIGLRERDIITGFAGSSVSAVEDLHKLLTENPFGNSYPIRILRSRIERYLNIVPAELNESESR